ncbi:MAG: hypothetical protein JNL80_07640 [Phycisphaerae bacterium]|nr:hypothetical protein [Phycisphaerae bacterium]
MALARRKAASTITPPAAGASRQATAPKPTRKRAPNRTLRSAPSESETPPIHPTLDRALRELLHRVDFPDAEILTYDDLHHWGDEAAAAFVSAGIVVPAGFATEIPCPECGDGTMVRVDRDPAGTCIAATCWGGDDPHRVRLAVDRARLWKFSLEGLASLVAASSPTVGRIEVVVADRLVLVGSAEFRGVSYEVFIARGTTWADREARIASAERLMHSPLPLVLSVDRAPVVQDWLPTRPAFGCLTTVLRWTNRGCAVRWDVLATQDAGPHPASDPCSWLSVTQAAERLLDVRSAIDLPKARARVSRAAGDSKFRTNGASGTARRIHEPSFSVWLLSERAKDLSVD